MVSLYNYFFVFSVREDSTIVKKQARIKAMTEHEARCMLSMHVKNLWIVLDVICEGKDRNWMIAGNFGSTKSHIEHVADWSEPDCGQQPFKEFVKKYRVAIAGLPMPALVKRFNAHEGYRVPTDEHLEILADETGERLDVVRAYAYREFYAHCTSKLIEIYGKHAVMRVLKKQSLMNEALRGDITNVKAIFDEHFSSWAILRHYPLTEGELFFYYDMQRGITRHVELYSGAILVKDLPKKVQRRLFDLDARFMTFANKESV